MYSKGKYVVGDVKSGFLAMTVALVFSEDIAHSDIRRLFVEGSITSAGFFYFKEDKVTVYGESISLSVKSKPTDEKFVGQAIGHKEYIR